MDATQHPATINIKGGITVYLTSCLKGLMDGGKDNVKQVGRPNSMGWYYIHVPVLLNCLCFIHLSKIHYTNVVKDIIMDSPTDSNNTLTILVHLHLSPSLFLLVYLSLSPPSLSLLVSLSHLLHHLSHWGSLLRWEIPFWTCCLRTVS